MSDNALQKLVSRLVEVGGVGDDADTTSNFQVPLHCNFKMYRTLTCHVAAGSEAGESSDDEALLTAATGKPIWPSSSMDQPSPIQAPRYVQKTTRVLSFPLDDHVASCAIIWDKVEKQNCGHCWARPAQSLFPNRHTLDAGAGSSESRARACGYEGDIGEGEENKKKKLSVSARRAAGIVPPGSSVKTVRINSSRVARPRRSPCIEARRGGLLVSHKGDASFLSGVSGHPPRSNARSQGHDPGQKVAGRNGGEQPMRYAVSVADTLRDLVSGHGERGRAIREMSLELQRRDNVSGHRESVLNESFRRERSDLSRRSLGAEARAAALEEEREQLRDRLAREVRRSKAESASLSSQLKQSEHRVRAREAAVQKLTDKLREEAERERATQRRERALLLKFQQGDAFRGGRGGGGGGSNDSRVAESLIAHSKAKERSEAEIDELRAEVLRLGDELREKERTILKHRLGPDWSPGLDGGGVGGNGDPAAADEVRDLRDRLAESERSARVMRQREARVLERCAEVEKECAELRAKGDEAQESLVNAQLELSSRPSLRNWRSSQRRIQDLETKLAQATSQAKEAMDVAELRRWVDTRELMRRDRGNHRLQLDRLEELPTTVLKQVVQDVCRLLSLQDVSLLSSSVSKLIKAVQMLPRLERFVNSVCVFVFRHSTEVLSAPSDGPLSRTLAGRSRTMEDVLPLLELWLARAQEPVKLKARELLWRKKGLLRVLETRAGRSQAARGSSLKSDRAAVSAIQRLVEFERRYLREMNLNEQADKNVNDDPSPVNRVVQHFQLLFGVASVGGCLPKLNEVYRFSSEAQTFLRTCGDLLGMPEATSPETVMRRLEGVLEGMADIDADAKLRVSHDAESWASRSVELAAGV
ncbi:unnamed protein product [Scytosiphon promiscuus]